MFRLAKTKFQCLGNADLTDFPLDTTYICALILNHV